MTASTSTAQLTRWIRREAGRLGFGRVGIAPVRESDHGELYRRWIAEGRHGEMSYLARPDAVERRLDPASAWDGVRSAVVVAHNYYTGDGDDAEHDPDRGVIARYARGRDYHKVVKKKLVRLLRRIEDETDRELPVARAYVDTGPVLERELARRAGIGWFGRNTMMIDPRRGSYFFLGVLLLELELEHDEPFEADRCGSCSACLDACPTGALLGRDGNGAPIMDARRCISYLTIENRGPIPRELRPLIGNRIYGCDICQEVCPWNGEKLVRITAESDYSARGPGERPTGVEALPGESASGEAGGGAEPVHPGTGAPSLIDLLETALDEASWDAFSRGSAVRRAGRAGFARNVCVGLGNWAAPAAVPVLVSALSDPDPLVRGHAGWALGRVGSPSAVAALERQAEREGDPWAAEEIAAALGS